MSTEAAQGFELRMAARLPCLTGPCTSEFVDREFMLCSKSSGHRAPAGTAASGRVSRLQGEKDSLCRLPAGRTARLPSKRPQQPSELLMGVSSVVF